MSKGQYLSSHQQGIARRFYEHGDTLSYQKVSEIVSELALHPDPKQAALLWKSVQRALAKAPVDQMKVARIIGERNVEALAKLAGELALAKPPANAPVAAAVSPAAPASAPATAPAPVPAAASPIMTQNTRPAMFTQEPAAPPTIQDLVSALKAFKKRLKLTRLDQESRLSARALTGGKKSDIVAIQPPNQFPRAVWDELVKQGKLRHTGSGFYELLGD